MTVATSLATFILADMNTFVVAVAHIIFCYPFTILLVQLTREEERTTANVLVRFRDGGENRKTCTFITIGMCDNKTLWLDTVSNVTYLKNLMVLVSQLSRSAS